MSELVKMNFDLGENEQNLIFSLAKVLMAF